MPRPALDFPPVSLPSGAVRLRQDVRVFLADRLPAGSYEPGLGMHGGFDRAFSRDLGARGWLGMTWPRRYGGHERSQLERYVVVEELLRVGAPVAAHWIADRQIGPSILHHGPEPLRRRFLPLIARGECAFSLGMSEPEAGSDLASVRTAARRVNGGWSLTGTKIWTGGAHVNDFAVVLCRTTPHPSGDGGDGGGDGAGGVGDRHEGLSQLVVDLRARGVTVEAIPNLDGVHRFNRVTFDEVFVGDDLVLGRIGQGWHQVTAELAFERAGPERFLSIIGLLRSFLAAEAAEAADAARAGAGASAVSGGPPGAAQEEIGDLVARLVVLRELSMAVAAAIDDGATPAAQAALVKAQGTEFEQDVVDVVRRRCGVEPDPTAPDGLASDLARAVAFSPGFTIQGGTNEVLRTVVSRALRQTVEV